MKLREDLCHYLEEEVRVIKTEGRHEFLDNVRDIVNDQMDKISDIINYGESYRSIAFT